MVPTSSPIASDEEEEEENEDAEAAVVAVECNARDARTGEPIGDEESSMPPTCKRAGCDQGAPEKEEEEEEEAATAVAASWSPEPEAEVAAP